MATQIQTFSPTPTEQQFEALNKAYQYFNHVLFAGQLPGCILNFSRKKGTHGFMAPGRWRRVSEENYTTHEISLTPYTLHRQPILVFSTLVHEQVHLWQFDFGTPSRSGYHNQEWAEKMQEVGLMPSHTGQPGGKRTGQNMTHYLIEAGPYERAFNVMPPEFILPFTSLEGDIMKSLLTGGSKVGSAGEPASSKVQATNVAKSRDKIKYTCPGCRVNVWGKPDLNVLCGDCHETLQPVKE